MMDQIYLKYSCPECDHAFELTVSEAFDKIIRCPECAEIVSDERLSELLKDSE